jgi:hypothetical protein
MGFYSNKMMSGANPAGYTDLGNGLAVQVGTAAFTTTGTSVTIRHPFGKKLYAVVFSPLGSAAAADANGELTLGGVTHNADGTLTCSTAGQFTVLRAAGTDSGLALSVIVFAPAKH